MENKKRISDIQHKIVWFFLWPLLMTMAIWILVIDLTRNTWTSNVKELFLIIICLAYTTGCVIYILIDIIRYWLKIKP